MIAGVAPAALLAALLVALAVDAAFGEPAALYRRVPHPVALIGRLTNALERRWFPEAGGPAARARAGTAVGVAVIAAAAAAGLAVQALAGALPGFGWALEGLAMSSLIAQRSLYDHVARVAAGLERGGLEEGRAAVAHIVGRDPESLDAHAVARAAIESTAENFSDGVVAPVFWALLLGLPGLAAYKAVNTLDSMIGHRSPRYEHFGRFAARLDDAANLVPARLSGALLVLAAWLTPGAEPGRGWRAMLRDAPRHRSPNAGWPEAAMAGALGLRLAGPRRYGGVAVDDAWMGDGRAGATAADVRRALGLFARACTLVAALVALALALLPMTATGA